ncbi:MAG: DsbA family protein, partial [Sphingomonadales bacterium]|nr:DsbA family protein [Sphingomonadales bacterium]
MRIKTSLMAVFCAFCSCLAIASPAVAGGITLGSKSAPLRAIEYIRYGCKDCAEYRLENIERMQELVEEGSVHLTIRAVPGIKQEVRPVALGLCVSADHGIDAYWAVEKQFFERNREWRSSDDFEATRAMLNIAQSVGYSEAEYEDCLRRDEVAEEIKQTGASLRENNVRVFP